MSASHVRFNSLNIGKEKIRTNEIHFYKNFEIFLAQNYTLIAIPMPGIRSEDI